MSNSNPKTNANSDALDKANEPVGDVNSASCGAQEPIQNPDSNGEQKAMEDSKSDAPGKQEPMDDSKPDVSNSAETPIEEGNPDLSGSAQVEKVDSDTPDSKRVPKREIKPVSSELIQQESTDHPPDSVQIELEICSDTSKETTVKNGGELSSTVESGSIADYLTEKSYKDHVCIDACIHGGARPKTKSYANKPKTNTDAETSDDESKMLFKKLIRFQKRTT